MISKTVLTREQAVQLYTVIFQMKGSEEYLNCRKGIQTRIATLWPEILKPAPGEDDWDKTETRSMELSETDKRTLGEGIRSILASGNGNGADLEMCIQYAKLCMVSKWFISVIAAKSIPAFEGQSDDEPELE